MKKILITLLALSSIFLSACGKSELMGDKLKELNKRNANIILQALQQIENQWITYRNEKIGFHFKYPSFFEITEKDPWINVIYKGQTEPNVFLSIVKQQSEGKNEGSKRSKTYNFTGIPIEVENMPFSNGWISRDANFKIGKNVFMASHILSIDAPKTDKLDDSNHALETEILLTSLERGNMDELTKMEIALFDKIITTIKSNNGFVRNGQTITLASEEIKISFTDEFGMMGNQGVSFGPKGFIPESPTDKKYEAPIYSLLLTEKRTPKEIENVLKGNQLFRFGPEKKKINNFEVVEWAEGGLCEGRTAEIVGTNNNLQFFSSGCHNQEAKTDFDYFENLIKNIIR